MIQSNRSRSRGFSLLEVLVAIVILSVGLLALASLQLTLIRASNDTKAQSTAMSLAKEKIDTLASYQSMGGTSSTCVSPAASNTNTCYRAITDQTGGSAEAINGVGGINYSRTTTVDRYVFRTSDSTFVLGSTAGFDDTSLDSAVSDSGCPTCITGKEFKRVLVVVGWTDAQGVTRNVQVEDAIPGLTPADSLSVNSTGSFGAPRQAIAIIPNQATVQGVIPIAIGNGSDTAATNPRPVIVSQGQNTTTTETRFDVYTYAAINGSTATAQSRVETAVVGCKCTLGTGTQTAFRPTYWNGFKYTVPPTLTGMPVSAPASNTTQSGLCTACCRDHHDPSGVAGPLFDPRRTTHNHYLHTDLTTPVTTGGSSYDEACRLIRVDGIFRVAAEPYNDHYGLLATLGVVNHTPTSCAGTPCTAAESANAFPGTGTGSVTESYQTFVLNYLKARFVDVTTYNTVTDPTTVTGYSTLQNPATATIQSSTSPQYLHTRGLYIDFLNPDAIAAIASAKAACVAASCTAAQLQTAVLKLLAFTSINTTEVAGPGWTASNTKIAVSNLNDLSVAINLGLPAAGKAAYQTGNNGETVDATSQMQRSSGGLAVLTPLSGVNSEIVFPTSELTNNILSDTQAYSIVGPVTQPAKSFITEVAGTAFRATAQAANPWTLYFGANTANGVGSPQNLPCGNSGVNLRPFTCTTQAGASPPNFTLGGLTYLVFSNYNRAFTSANSTVIVGNGCTGGTTPFPYIRNYDVSSVSPSPVSTAVTNLNGSNEYTTVGINPVNENDTVTFTMSSAATYFCPTNWSTYITANGSIKTPFSGACTTGAPASRKPQWATTYGACPASVTFPP